MKKTWPEFWLWLLCLLRLWQVRPTSETIVNHMFTQWIHSYRDLPLMVNQVKVRLPIANSFQSWRVCYVHPLLFFSFLFFHFFLLVFFSRFSGQMSQDGRCAQSRLWGLLNFCGRRVTQLMQIQRRQKRRFASYRTVGFFASYSHWHLC